MIDKVLERLRMGRPHSDLTEGAAEEEEQVLDVGHFGVLRGMSERAISLELRKRDGSIKAINCHVPVTFL